MIGRSPKRQPGLDAPRSRARTRAPQPSRDRFGRFTEWIARAMGTPWFLLGLSLFCVLWLAWNTLSPAGLRFDSSDNGFTALTLVLSLQASYAAPLILLAQNRQDDRDRVQIEQDRQRAERNLADTEYLAREIVALRLLVAELSREVVTRDALRGELVHAIDEIDARRASAGEATPSAEEQAASDARREREERRRRKGEQAEQDARER